MRGEGHDRAHRCGRLQHVVPREVLRRGANGNLRLGDLEADLGPLGHWLEADAPLDQRLSASAAVVGIRDRTGQVRRVRTVDRERQTAQQQRNHVGATNARDN